MECVSVPVQLEGSKYLYLRPHPMYLQLVRVPHLKYLSRGGKPTLNIQSNDTFGVQSNIYN